MNRKDYFSKVFQARQALSVRALGILKKYLKTADLAAKRGQFEVALEAYRWLLAHAPQDADGITILDIDIDKPKQLEGKTGPSINIGFAIGGMPQPKELPAAEALDVTPKPETKPDPAKE